MKSALKPTGSFRDAASNILGAKPEKKGKKQEDKKQADGPKKKAPNAQEMVEQRKQATLAQLVGPEDTIPIGNSKLAKLASSTRKVRRDREGTGKAKDEKPKGAKPDKLKLGQTGPIFLVKDPERDTVPVPKGGTKGKESKPSQEDALVQDALIPSDQIIKKGQNVRYKQKDGSMVSATVVGVDYSVFPPVYQIQVDGKKQHETDRDKLYLPQRPPTMQDLEELMQELKDHSRRPSLAASSTWSSTSKQKLEVELVRIENLPDVFTRRMPAERRHEISSNGGVTGVYVKMKYLEKLRESTRQWDVLDPQWNEKFPMPYVADDDLTEEEEEEDMEVRVFEYVGGGTRDRVLCKCMVSGRDLRAAPVDGDGQPKEIEMPLLDHRHKRVHNEEGKHAFIVFRVKKRGVPTAALTRTRLDSLRSSRGE